MVYLTISAGMNPDWKFHFPDNLEVKETPNDEGTYYEYTLTNPETDHVYHFKASIRMKLTDLTVKQVTLDGSPVTYSCGRYTKNDGTKQDVIYLYNVDDPGKVNVAFSNSNVTVTKDVTQKNSYHNISYRNKNMGIRFCPYANIY